MENEKIEQKFTIEELIEEISMPVVAYAGEAKSLLREALNFAKEGDFNKAEKFLAESEESISKAHTAHRKVIVESSINPEAVSTPFILIHAEDHLMSAISEKSVYEELINIYKVIKQIQK